MLSSTEENYLKALLRIATEKDGNGEAGTNQLALKLNVKPATATDMLKKLKEKGLVEYQKYKKISLTDTGRALATGIIRKHRLWETFLFKKLGFSWDEVHDVAEQLEHIQSDKLVEQLDNFLGYPQFDPHGDMIPRANGELKSDKSVTLAETLVGTQYTIVSVTDNGPDFLQYLSQLKLGIQSVIHVLTRFDFDGSVVLKLHDHEVTVSKKVAENIYVV
ncbi:iron (metal) dependent repressor, DtxR family [bacterium A37T11]|nr:iron (metal) dependent repressor, DtxR family [bacterium A37T11]